MKFLAVITLFAAAGMAAATEPQESKFLFERTLEARACDCNGVRNCCFKDCKYDEKCCNGTCMKKFPGCEGAC
ncbi:hypothetical protein PG995_009240 [Apiospora arundinis]